jgi:AcrR family transcriptional regulator
VAANEVNEAGETSDRPEPWWVNDPEMVAIRQRMMDEFGPGSTEPAERESPTEPETPDPVLADVLDGASVRKLAGARDDLDRARRQYADAVVTARAAGLSWGEIARVLGVSRQSLHRRFGDVTPVY